MRFSTIIKEFFRYLFPRRPWRRVPNQLISQYRWRGLDAKQHERILMRRGAARSTDEARRLMEHYHVTTAWEVLAQLPPAPEVTLIDRWRALVRRADGHDYINRYELKDRTQDQIPVKYRFMDTP